MSMSIMRGRLARERPRTAHAARGRSRGSLTARALQFALLGAIAGFVVFSALPAHAAPANDNFPGTALSSNSEGTITGSTVGATGQAGEPTNAGSSTDVSNHRSVWYSWTSNFASGRATVDTCTNPAGWDTTIGVYTGSTVE